MDHLQVTPFSLQVRFQSFRLHRGEGGCVSPCWTQQPQERRSTLMGRMHHAPAAVQQAVLT